MKSDPPTGVESIDVSVADMATGSEVFDPLRDQVTDDKYVTHDVSGRYSSAPRKALAELRTEYVKDVRSWMDRVESARSESTSDANEQMSDAAGGATDVLNKGIGFAQDALAGSISEPDADIEDPLLLGDVSYSVDGSPSYLTLNPVTRQTSPAVRPEHRSVTEVADSDHAPMLVRKDNTFGHPGLPLIPWPTYWYLSVDHWDVEVNGEYARFEVTANHDDPAGTKTSYVRQAMPVELEIAGQQRTVGEVEPIEFSSSTNVVVAVPGGTVQPKPRYGVGDRWHGSGGPYKSACSSTWPHVGPDFAPSDVDYDQCNNLQQQDEPTLQQYLPGSDTVESIPLEVEADGDVELEEEDEGEFNDECDEPEDLKDELDDTGTDRLEDHPDAVQQEVTDAYCALVQPGYRGMFEHVFQERDESVTHEWVQMATIMDKERVRETLDYLTEDVNGDGRPLGMEHEIQEFKSATAHNADSSGTSDLPPHRSPGIVTKIETENDELRLARIYGDGQETDDTDVPIAGVPLPPRGNSLQVSGNPDP